MFLITSVAALSAEFFSLLLLNDFYLTQMIHIFLEIYYEQHFSIFKKCNNSELYISIKNLYKKTAFYERFIDFSVSIEAERLNLFILCYFKIFQEKFSIAHSLYLSQSCIMDYMTAYFPTS